ncbi:MAG: glucose-6-phosphate isomerase [Haloferacaceae archaeon]
MRVDIGNALDEVATPGVPRAALDRLDERVADAHERIERGRVNGEHGYAALALPGRTDPDAVRAATGRFDDPAAVLVVGIGGSALGAATLAAAAPADEDAPPVYVLDNVDPAHVRRTLADLPLDRTVVNVVSKSGTTAETLANFLVVREAMARAGVDWTERTLVTTGEAGNLRRLADRHDLPTLRVPDGVPGRFSALSPVGMAPAALRGVDLDALLAGGRAAVEGLAGSLFESPAYAYGATCYALDRRGASTNAMMPYAEALDPFAEWFAQLWAESLGKDGLGQTPVRALGATDQHSQLQLYRAGPRDKLVTFVRPRERTGDAAGGDGDAECPIPETDLSGLAYLGGESLGGLLDAEFRATEASLAAAGRPSVRVEVDRLDARGVGELLVGMEAACVLVGELLGVETFTQPAVEWGKRAARGLLGGDCEAEAAEVAGKTELVVD